MTKENIISIQNLWADGIIEMGKLSNRRESLELFASDFLDEMYDFEDSVLFKPTKAAEEQFRNTKNSALSYFIAGNRRKCKEDTGFALSCWTEIIFENSKIIINRDIAAAMGNYTFSNDENSIKVEYSFVYKYIGDKLKIILHHSSLPYRI